MAISDYFGNLFGSLGNVGSNLFGFGANTTPTVTPPTQTPIFSAQEAGINNLSQIQNQGVENFDFTNTDNFGISMAPVSGSAIKTIPTSSAGNNLFVPQNSGLGNANNITGTPKPNAPGLGGQQGSDWVKNLTSLAAVGSGLWNDYQNRKDRRFVIRENTRVRQNARDRAKNIQDQMTGGQDPLGGQDYSTL